eukprot:NODE_220_length_1790_cov_65.368754_g169_i0.p3 GENE.NODE_220_length_1790_cov_65.368754_g169_i0~~NODE_220_length_1790_cov_65.368754_g169_i0.p3  ORF type:complete len:142 (+),score=48.69 NODE_220_length_1790_cov_65.368754_g169_i0:28-426(+)
MGHSSSVMALAGTCQLSGQRCSSTLKCCGGMTCSSAVNGVCKSTLSVPTCKSYHCPANYAAKAGTISCVTGTCTTAACCNPTCKTFTCPTNQVAKAPVPTCTSGTCNATVCCGAPTPPASSLCGSAAIRRPD